MFYRSRVGLTLSLMYVIPTILLLFLSNSAGDTDDKSRFVLMQAPIATQLMLLHELGIDINGFINTWLGAYIFLWTPTVILLYMIGGFLEVFLDFGLQGIKSIFPNAECPNCNSNISRFSNERVPCSNFMGIFKGEVVCPVCQFHIMNKTFDTYIVLFLLFLMWKYFNSEVIRIIFELMLLSVILYSLFAKRIFRKVTNA